MREYGRKGHHGKEVEMVDDEESGEEEDDEDDEEDDEEEEDEGGDEDVVLWIIKNAGDSFIVGEMNSRADDNDITILEEEPEIFETDTEEKSNEESQIDYCLNEALEGQS
jgi:hypothetical protein